MRSTVTAIAVTVFLSVGCSRYAGEPAPRGRPEDEKPDVEIKKSAAGLQGNWIEPHALAKQQAKGKGDYYTWVFSEDKVAWCIHRTIDGRLVDTKSLGIGTFKIDATAIPRKMDIDWGEGKMTPCIFEFNGDTLRLNTGGTERPTTFEDGEIFVLQRHQEK